MFSIAMLRLVIRDMGKIVCNCKTKYPLSIKCTVKSRIKPYSRKCLINEGGDFTG